MTSFDDGDKHLERICKKKYKKIMPARQAKKQNPPQESEMTMDEPGRDGAVISSPPVAEESVALDEAAQADLEVQQIVGQSHKEEEEKKEKRKKKKKKHKKSHKKHRKHNKSREGKLAVDKEINMRAFSDEDEDEEIIQEYKWSLKRPSQVIEVEDSDSEPSRPKRDMTLQDLKDKYRYLENITLRLTRQKAKPKEKAERKSKKRNERAEDGAPVEEGAQPLDTIPTAAMAQSVID